MGIAKIKPTQPQLWLAGAWAELGKIGLISQNPTPTPFPYDIKKNQKKILISKTVNNNRV